MDEQNSLYLYANKIGIRTRCLAIRIGVRGIFLGRFWRNKPQVNTALFNWSTMCFAITNPARTYTAAACGTPRLLCESCSKGGSKGLLCITLSINLSDSISQGLWSSKRALHTSCWWCRDKEGSGEQQDCKPDSVHSTLFRTESSWHSTT